MFDRFTHESRRAVFFARKEAGARGAPSIAGEHPLLGLLHQEKCLAAHILLDRGFYLEKFRSQRAPLNPFDFE
jgi:hypothetical protein